MWWKLCKALRTPFVFLLDSKYIPVTVEEAKFFCSFPFRYIPEIRDCDDAAWQTKANASRAGKNGVGFIIGWATWANSLHAWNCFITPEGKVLQIEPQTGLIVSNGYIPIGVIL